MKQIGVDVFLDIHGDEALPYIFVAGCEGNPGYDARHAALEEQFKAAFMAASPDFQDQYGYPKNEPGKANLSLATNYVGETFNCLAFTIEMPFKDNANLPDEEYGWSAERSERLGRDVLTAVCGVLGSVR